MGLFVQEIGKNLLERSLVISHWSLVSELRRLKVSIPFFYTNYKLQITNKKTKGGHGLHKDSFRLQTMTALIKSFCGGVQGGQFFQKAPPPAAGGRI
jgi:hypothetical protein